MQKIKQYFKRLFAKHYYIGEMSALAISELYYNVVITCKNCDNKFDFFIKKGIRVNGIIGNIRCPRCKCKVV